MAKITKKEFITSLKEMSIQEVMELVSALKEEFGIDPSTMVSATTSAPVAKEEAPSEVTISLKAIGGNKVAVIKVVKDITGVGLMDAKKIVESAPVKIKENIKPEEAEEIKKKLIEAGAEVSIE